MKCKNCGSELASDAKFCRDCGNKIEQDTQAEGVDLAEKEAPEKILCKNCGSELVPKAIFCMNCGNKVENDEQRKETELDKEEVQAKKDTPPEGEVQTGNETHFKDEAQAETTALPEEEVQPEKAVNKAPEEIFCKKCGHKLNIDDGFCSKCGAGISKGAVKTETKKTKRINFWQRMSALVKIASILLVITTVLLAVSIHIDHETSIILSVIQLLALVSSLLIHKQSAKSNKPWAKYSLSTAAVLLLIITMLLTAANIIGCLLNRPSGPVNSTNKSAPVSESSVPSRDYDENDLTSVLGEITNDFADVISYLMEKQEETFSNVGATYKDYQKNKSLVDDWIELVLTESDALFARTRENSIVYFKLIAADPDHKYSEFCEDALDEYYDAVYDDAMDEYYDKLYDDAMDDLYDEYYDGILDDAYDKDEVEYKEWSTASSECYKVWSDASSAIYKKWSNESSYLYGLWSVMDSAFCRNENYDVDAIITEYEQKKAEEDAKRAAKEAKEYTDFDVLYEINSNGDAEVVGFTGEGNQVTIRSEYSGKDVVRIADSAFENCTMLEQVIIWADIEEIGNAAFKGCTGLTEFSIPSDTEVIGHHAFEGCSNLETLIIWGDPDIGEYAFADCISLTEISIGSDTKNVGAHAFEGCIGVTSLTIWGVEIIGDYAFAGCTGIDEVSIPRKVLSIGNHAFDGCTALASMIVWGDDTAIGKDAFANCPNLSDVPASRGTVLECTMSKSDSSGSANHQSELGVDGMRPKFKEAMDSYEAFYDEYCEVMKQYSKNPTDIQTLTKYTGMMSKLIEMDEAFNAWNQNELNDAELKYYLEVQNRVMQKIVDVAG